MTIKRVAGAVIVLAVLAAVGVFGYKKWWLHRPSIANFNRAVNLQLKTPGNEGGGTFNFDASRQLCVGVPHSLLQFPSSGSATGMLGWTVSLPIGNEASGAKDQAAITKLDALVRVGLFTRTEGMVTDHRGDSHSVVQYHMTLKGWKATGFRMPSSCLQYAQAKSMGVTSFEKQVGDNNAGIEVYRVRALIGASPDRPVADWANDPGVQAVFPEIVEGIRGTEKQFILARGAGDWEDASQMLMSHVNMLIGDDKEQVEAKAKATKDQKAASDLGEEELKSLLPVQQHWLDDEYCVPMPGKTASLLPVDRDESDSVSGIYAVDVYTARVRQSFDRVKRSLPYLSMLESAGVVEKHEISMPADRHDTDQTPQPGLQYTLASGFQSRLNGRRNICFSPGKPTVNFVDLRIVNDNKDPDGFKTKIGYKVHLHFDQAPAWMNDQALKQKWSELGHVIDDGRVCEGIFVFDRVKRRLSSGKEQCAWAFASVLDYF